MTLFPTYDKRVMEAVRQLSLEEALTALAELAILLREDRLRDLGLSREMTGSDNLPIRPASAAWAPVVHAMKSAGFEDEFGFQRKADLIEIFGEEEGEAIWANAQETLEAYEEIGAIMEEEDVDLSTGAILRATGNERDIAQEMADKIKEYKEQERKNRTTHPSIPEIPNDLEGFGW